MTSIESLESRRLLSATVSVSSRHTLIVTGTSGADNIVVDASGSGFRVTDGANVIYDTTHFVIGQAVPRLDRVEVNAAGGNDRIGTTANVTSSLLVNGGAGDDRIGVVSDHATISGGAGNDKLVATPSDRATALSEGSPPSAHNVYFGGAGDDVIVASAYGETADGGSGRDRLYLNAAGLNVSTALPVPLEGNSGVTIRFDNVGFAVHAVNVEGFVDLV